MPDCQPTTFDKLFTAKGENLKQIVDGDLCYIPSIGGDVCRTMCSNNPDCTGYDMFTFTKDPGGGSDRGTCPVGVPCCILKQGDLSKLGSCATAPPNTTCIQDGYPQGTLANYAILDRSTPDPHALYCPEPDPNAQKYNYTISDKGKNIIGADDASKTGPYGCGYWKPGQDMTTDDCQNICNSMDSCTGFDYFTFTDKDVGMCPGGHPCCIIKTGDLSNLAPCSSNNPAPCIGGGGDTGVYGIKGDPIPGPPPVSPPGPPPSSSSDTVWIIVIVVLLLVLVGIGVGYYFWQKKHPSGGFLSQVSHNKYMG